MNQENKTIIHNELIEGCIINKNNQPIIVTNTTIIDLLQNPELYSPILISNDLLATIGFHKTENRINKEIYYDAGNSIVRVIYDTKSESYRLNFRYVIQKGSGNIKITDNITFNQLSQLQFYLTFFYKLKLDPNKLLEGVLIYLNNKKRE